MRLAPMAALLRSCDWCRHAGGSGETLASLNQSHAAQAKKKTKKNKQPEQVPRACVVPGCIVSQSAVTKCAGGYCF